MLKDEAGRGPPHCLRLWPHPRRNGARALRTGGGDHRAGDRGRTSRHRPGHRQGAAARPRCSAREPAARRCGVPLLCPSASDIARWARSPATASAIAIARSPTILDMLRIMVTLIGQLLTLNAQVVEKTCGRWRRATRCCRARSAPTAYAMESSVWHRRSSEGACPDRAAGGLRPGHGSAARGIGHGQGIVRPRAASGGSAAQHASSR